MGFFSTLFNNGPSEDEKLINQALSTDAKKSSFILKNVFKRVKHQGLEYGGSLSKRGASFVPSEYDLNQIAAIMDIDSYLRRAVEKYIELILKNGFEFVGKNSSTVKYVRKRFEQIAQVTNIPTNQLFEDLCQQLVAYGNTFISKVRNVKASGGRTRVTFYGKELDPVAGYYVEDATSMNIAKTTNGEIIGYRQSIKGAIEEPEWVPEDMIHIYYSRKRGLSFGTPLCYPVIDDIKALRKIEQNIEILSYQHTIPIIHYKVGTKDRPGDPVEVTAIKDELEGNPPYGCIVTTERHEILGIDVNINADGIDKIADVFKMRVYAGLGMSPLVMGDTTGTGRQTAESLDRQMENTAEKFVSVIKTFVDEFMIKELLLEGGYKYDAYNQTDKVELYFPPINMESKNKVEEHLNNMYQGNVLTETEVRVAMGRDPMSDEQRMDTHLQHVQIPLAVIKAVDETYTGPGHGTPSKQPGTETAKAVKQAVSPVTQVKRMQAKIANVAQPANQHGKQLARPRTTKDSYLVNKLLNHYKATNEDIISAVEDGSIQKGVNSIKKISLDLMKNDMKDALMVSYKDGYKTVNNIEQINFNEYIWDSIEHNNNIITNHLNSIVDKSIKFIDNESDMIKKYSLIQSTFENNKPIFEDHLISEIIRAYNFGIIQANIDSDKKELVYIKDECLIHQDVEIKDTNHIPPFNTTCRCYLGIKENENVKTN
jgi:hypothetical protein